MSGSNLAFPMSEIVTEYDDSRHEYSRNVHSNPIAAGLTKREYFAGLAMQGLLAQGEVIDNGAACLVLADRAVGIATALLAELDK